MKTFIVMALFVSSAAFAQTKTGNLTCFVESEGKVLRASSEISQNQDGTGGVAAVQVEGFGIRCSGSGVSKFGISQITDLSITTPAGDEISAAPSDKSSAILVYNKSVRCACMVEAE
jgi:hypothetical protein